MHSEQVKTWRPTNANPAEKEYRNHGGTYVLGATISAGRNLQLARWINARNRRQRQRKMITPISNAMNTDSDTKEKLDLAAYQSAWAFVGEVERGNISYDICRRLAAKFLEAYAERYNDENCRFRARKIKNQTK